MKLAIDTNRYSDFRRGEPVAVRTFEHAPAIYVPPNVVAELRSGFQRGNRGAQNEQLLSSFLQSPGVHLLSPDEETTRHDATLYAQLRKQATPIPVNDLWIASLVVQHGLTLFTRDAHFDHLPQIPRR